MNQKKLIKFSKQSNKERIKDKNGYILIYAPNNPFSKHNYCFEHRIEMEAKLGRLLSPEEVVHHIDFNKENNDINNLMLFPNQTEHAKFHQKLKQFGMTKHIINQIQNRWEK